MQERGGGGFLFDGIEDSTLADEECFVDPRFATGSMAWRKTALSQLGSGRRWWLWALPRLMWDTIVGGRLRDLVSCCRVHPGRRHGPWKDSAGRLLKSSSPSEPGWWCLAAASHCVAKRIRCTNNVRIASLLRFIKLSISVEHWAVPSKPGQEKHNWEVSLHRASRCSGPCCGGAMPCQGKCFTACGGGEEVWVVQKCSLALTKA